MSLDSEMKEEELVEEFGWWGDHPQFTPELWRADVMDGDTRRGYWTWVAERVVREGSNDTDPIAIYGSTTVSHT